MHACVKLNDLSSFHRYNMGQGGVSLCSGSWSGSGLCAARTASHGSHHRRLPGRVCPQDLGDMAKKERRLGKRCCLIKLASTHAVQKITPLMKVRALALQLYAEKTLNEILFHSSVANVLIKPVLVRLHTALLLPHGPILNKSATLVLSFLCGCARLIQSWPTRVSSVPDLNISRAASQSQQEIVNRGHSLGQLFSWNWKKRGLPT